MVRELVKLYSSILEASLYTIGLFGMSQLIRNNFLNAILIISLITLAYAFAFNNDYHELIDKVTPIKYNCNMLIGGWHPDVPPQVIEECRKKRYETQSY